MRPEPTLLQKAGRAWMQLSAGCAVLPFIFLVGLFVPTMLEFSLESMIERFVGALLAHIICTVALLPIPLTLIWLALNMFQYSFKKRREVSRIRQGLCRKCGYDVRENESQCPECGAVILREIPADLADWA